MSRKTKAELEAEITELQARVAELERDNRYLRELRKMAFEDAERADYRSDVIEKAHQAAIDETIRLHGEKPNIIKAARSENARNAAKERHAIPLPTEAALKKDFLERQQADTTSRLTTIYKDMAEAYAQGRKHWRRIRTQVEK